MERNAQSAMWQFAMWKVADALDLPQNPLNQEIFVCEYVGSVQKLDDVNNDWGDVCNKQMNTGCYCLDVTLDGNRYVIDATNEPNHPGRCINHARKHPKFQT